LSILSPTALAKTKREKIFSKTKEDFSKLISRDRRKLKSAKKDHSRQPRNYLQPETIRSLNSK
jgi:hypothetical protein